MVAPRRLLENHDYTGLESIARIRSDKEYDRKILYYLSGPGVDQSPLGRFSIDHNTGFVKIHAILDREEIAMYNLTGIAKFTDGTVAEKDIDIKIYVDDANDCSPVITERQVASVTESSASGTFVMQVKATDADEVNTIRSKIFYSIDESTNPGGMFMIDPQTGVIRVKKNTLDRETKEMYKLIIRVSDMGGAVGGNSGSGEVMVKITDINDNIPRLEKETYVGSVEENTVNVEVLRLQAIDMDLIHTENWLAVYEIVTGNEGGYFTITTDPKTNEGIIKIKKQLDYEEIKSLNLGVVVRNKAEYFFGSQTTTVGAPKPYPVTINVLNQKEGPRFQPTVKVVTLSEDQTSVSLNKVITTYAAIDSDTLLTATNVRYAKIKDDDNWLIIDEQTADIRLNKLPDRESTFLVNGTYYAKIICISNDTPSKTATGTIAIQVEDFNDHCPKLTGTTHTMCLGQNVIFVTAVDEDGYPNAAPFDFTIIKSKTKGDWVVEPHNDTTAILRDQANLWPGIYQVALDIKDQQGHSCGDVQVTDVTVCTCDETTKTCRSRRTSTSDLGVGAILLLLLGLLLLLLLPLLLLFCLCGGAANVADFKAIPFDTKQQLMTYHTEGIGEDKEVPLLQIPVEVDSAATKDVIHYGDRGQGGFIELGGMEGGGINVSGLTTEELSRYNQYRQWMAEKEELKLGQENYYSHYRDAMFDGMALSETFLGEYYSTKSKQNTEQSEQKDALLMYDYEGRESLAGSVGCCSLLENDNDLSFLNDLGPKFKTLAEICQGSRIETGAFDAEISIPSVKPSTHTHLHTHTETIRDRDRVNINAVDTSNIVTGSSTIIKDQHMTEQSQSSATLSKVNVQDKIVIPSQTVLIQQPAMYYAATPMYVVEPQSQVLLVGGAQQQAVGQVASVGLGQGLVQVAGLQGSQGMVLVDRQVGAAGVVGQVGQVRHGLAHGTKSRKVLVVENGSSGVEHRPAGMIRTTQGATSQGFEVRGPSILLSSSGSVEANKDISVATTTPRVQGSQKMVVQHKKVSVTERNIDSSTRA